MVITTTVLNYHNTIHLYHYTTKICTTQDLLRSTVHGPLWPAYVLRRGPFLARLIFLNEKALERRDRSCDCETFHEGKKNVERRKFRSWVWGAEKEWSGSRRKTIAFPRPKKVGNHWSKLTALHINLLILQVYFVTFCLL